MTLVSQHPHSKFQLLEKPGAYPGLDIINGTPDGPVIDLSVDMDNKYGIGYIQVRDVEEMARVLGYVTPEVAAAKDARIAELEAQVNRVPTKIERLTNELRATVDRFVDSLSVDDDIPVDSSETYAKQIGVGDSEQFSFDFDNNSANGIAESDDGKADNDSGQDGDNVVDQGPDELSSNPINVIDFGFLTDDD
jgi:hypothetical protein